MAIKFKLKDVDRLIDKLKKGAKQAAIRGLYAAAIRIQSHILNVLIPAAEPKPVDRSVFRAGWITKRMKEGAKILNTAPHAPFIEFGVRAENVVIGRKMIEALTEWVVRKGIGDGTTSPTQLAWAIAKSMQENGIFQGGEGFRFLETAIHEKAAEFVREEINREFRKKKLIE